MLAHPDRSCRSDLLFHPVTVYCHRVGQSKQTAYNARCLAGKSLEYQSLSHWYDWARSSWVWSLQNSQRSQWRRATGDYNPSTGPINRLARHEQTTIFRLLTGHWSLQAQQKQIGIMGSALCNCKEAEHTSTTSSRTVPSGGNWDTSYGHRMSRPPTGYGEQQNTCAAPYISCDMWTEGLSTANQPQKKKIPVDCSHHYTTKAINYSQTSP